MSENDQSNYPQFQVVYLSGNRCLLRDSPIVIIGDSRTNWGITMACYDGKLTVNQ